ncbi:MAG: CPBP family intramembrane glutamic endopeptidase [Candidatus Omnitrophota bacterium]
MKVLWVWLLAGLAALAVFIAFFDYVFPFASIDVKVSKEQALEESAKFIRSQGFELAGYDRAITFDSDFEASVYLQKTQGIKKSNELIEQGIPVWFWRVRWFRELEKEGFLVFVDPSTAQVLFFRHFVLEDSPGASLSKDKAVGIAQGQLSAQGAALSEFELKDSTTTTQKHRTDYNFSWEKKGYSVDQATLRVDADIYGATLGKYRKYLKVPEEFRRYLQKELSFGRMLSVASTVLKYILVLIAIFVLYARASKEQAAWKFWLAVGSVVALWELVDFFNSLPLWWSYYPDTMSKVSFFTESLGSQMTQVLSSGLIVLACGALGEMSNPEFLRTRCALFSSIKNKTFSLRAVAPVFVVGYSAGFIFLAYITLFYLCGTRYFHIWLPPESEYSNMFGMFVPFLFPLTIAITAALQEECMYRFFGVSFLKKWLNKTWWALFIPALLWGFSHSFYHVFPTYVRGIELTIFGIFLGLIFLRYGLETVIIAHFVINATLASVPLLRSHSSLFVSSGVLVVALALAPLALFPFLKMRAGRTIN